VGRKLRCARGRELTQFFQRLEGGGDTVCKVPSQSRAGRRQTTGIRSRCTRRHAAGCSLSLASRRIYSGQEEGRWKEDATSEGTGVVEYVPTTEAWTESRADVKDMGEWLSSHVKRGTVMPARRGNQRCQMVLRVLQGGHGPVHGPIW
jgi:hypothetical protein